ncbi:MAG: glycine cleavage T C-terminal barrel domain-containing protein, partial [Pseudonocardiaceae bacterium]
IGYEIYLHNAYRDAGRLWDRVWQAGLPHGMQPIGPCHIRRIEGGILAYGADITLATNPLEVGYDYRWMVDLDQDGDFVGKQALTRIKAEGISRLMVGVEIEGEPLGTYNDGSMIERFGVYSSKCSSREAAVGAVTSACYSPRLARNIGLAMLPIELSHTGTEITIQTPTGMRAGVVVKKPFIDPRKETPKG